MINQHFNEKLLINNNINYQAAASFYHQSFVLLVYLIISLILVKQSERKHDTEDCLGFER